MSWWHELCEYVETNQCDFVMSTKEFYRIKALVEAAKRNKPVEVHEITWDLQARRHLEERLAAAEKVVEAAGNLFSELLNIQDDSRLPPAGTEVMCLIRKRDPIIAALEAYNKVVKKNE